MTQSRSVSQLYQWLGMGTRMEPALVVVLLLDGAAPFWSGRFLPFLDMPQHLAIASILGRLSDPLNAFASYYYIDTFLTPYWGYYAPMWLLTRVLSVEFSNKLFLSLWAVLLPVAVGYFLRSIGRDWRWAVFSMPLVWNVHLFLGFTTLLASMPIFLLTLGVFARDLRATKLAWWRSTLVALLACAVFFCHAQTYLLLSVTAMALVVVEWRGLTWAFSRSLALLPSLGLFATWFASQFFSDTPPISKLHAVHRPLFGRFFEPDGLRFEPFAETLSKMPERVWGSYGDGSETIVGALWVLLFSCGLVLARRAAGDPTHGISKGWQARLQGRRGEVLAIIALCAYLFLPFEIGGQPYFNFRYLVFSALLAPAFFRAPAAGGRLVLVYAVAALAFVADINAAWKIALFQREVGNYSRVVERMEPGERALGLIFDRGDDGLFTLSPYLHFAAYYQVERGGDIGMSFAGLPAIPVRYRDGFQAPHPDEWRPEEFEWDTMGRYYDYFLVRGQMAGGAAEVEERTTLVMKEGAWRLYRRSTPATILSP